MTLNTFEKLTAAALSALLLAVPVSPAAAWDEICVKFPAGVGYAGHFNVIHGFEPRADGKMPGRAVGEGLMGTSRHSPDKFLHKLDAAAADLAVARTREEEARAEWERREKILSDTPTWSPDYFNYGRLAGSAEKFLYHRQQGRENEQKRLSGLTESLTWIPDIVHNPPDVFAEDALPARGVIRSGRIRFPQTGCVSVRKIRRGEPFYVLLYADKKTGAPPCRLRRALLQPELVVRQPPQPVDAEIGIQRPGLPVFPQLRIFQGVLNGVKRRALLRAAWARKRAAGELFGRGGANAVEFARP